MNILLIKKMVNFISVLLYTLYNTGTSIKKSIKYNGIIIVINPYTFPPIWYNLKSSRLLFILNIWSGNSAIIFEKPVIVNTTDLWRNPEKAQKSLNRTTTYKNIFMSCLSFLFV